MTVKKDKDLLKDSTTKAKSVDKYISHINKIADSEKIAYKITDEIFNSDHKFLKTGNVVLDILLANEHWYTSKGGIPMGRIVEIAGTESCVTGDTLVEAKIFDKNTNQTKVGYFHLIDIIHEHGSKIDEGFVEVNTPHGFQKVKEHFFKGILPVYKLILNNTFILRGTSEHLVKAEKDNVQFWIPLNKITKDMMIHTKQGLIGVLETKLTELKEKIYDLEIDHSSHCYYTNDILSHNSGKSALALSICKQVLKENGYVIYFDTERALDKDFASRLANLDEYLDRFIISEPNTIEELFNILEKILPEIRKDVGNDVPITIIWDSLAATPASQERDKLGYNPNEGIGMAARTISLGLKKIANMISEDNITFIILNQLKHRIPAPMFGEKYVTPGGKALHYFSSLRIFLSTKGKINNINKYGTKNTIGSVVRAKVKKSRMGSENQMGNLYFYFDKGFNEAESVFETLKLLKALTKDGHSYKYWKKYFENEEWFKEFNNDESKWTKKIFIEKYNNEEHFKNVAIDVCANCLIVPHGKDVELEIELDSPNDDNE